MVVVQPFRPVGVRLLRHKLRPYIGFLVSFDTLVGRAPPDFEDDTWPLPSLLCDVPPGWSAYIWPGSGSSDTIRLVAACASEKMVTRSGVVFLLDASSSARARAARSAS